MAFLVKALKFVGGISQEINPNIDSLYAKSFVVGGAAGTELTKAILDTLSGGSNSDAGSLHMHDGRYFTKAQHINASAGNPNAGAPMLTDARGKIDPSFYQQSDITHGNLSGLSADDHPQYFNQSRGDARYFTQAQFVATSAGVSSAGAPVKLNAAGQIDSSMINSSSSNHEQLSGLLGGAASEHYHLTHAEHDTLTTGADASSLHIHDSRYYTQTQINASLALKADLTVVIKKDGSVAFTGDQSMGSHKLTFLADPATSSDAANKNYVDNQDALKVSKTGDSMTGALSMGGNAITSLADPVAPTDAANKRYVDAARAGLVSKDPVKAATTGPLPGNSYSGVPETLTASANAAFPQIDGQTISVGDSILVKDEAAPANNGIYTLTTAGSGSAAWVLTRRSDFNSTSTIVEGSHVFVDFGTANAYNEYVMNAATPSSVGTSPITFTKYSGAGQLVAGQGIAISNNTIATNPGAGISNASGANTVNLHPASGLDTIDPTTQAHSTAADAQLSAKLADSTLTRGSSGLAVGVIQTANVADQSITTPKIADANVTQQKMAANSVGTSQIIDANVTTAKIADGAVHAAKLAADTAGVALAQNATTKALDVQTDNASIDVNGSNQIEIKAKGVSRAKVADAAIGSTQIDFGLSAGQVNAGQQPIVNAAAKFAGTTVEAALDELSNAAYIVVETAGEAIGQGDLVVMRRDASNNSRAFKASAAASDNYVAATLVLQNITYTAIVPSGNQLSVRYLNPGVVNAALAVSVTGTVITVSLATDGTGTLTSTATQIAAAVNASPSAGALASAAVSGTGSHIESAAAAQNLSGGMDYNDNGRWEVYGMCTTAAASAGASLHIMKIGKLACNFVVAPTSSDIGKAVYLSTNQGKAVINVAPSNSQEGIVFLGRVVSLTQVEFRAPTLRGVNG